MQEEDAATIDECLTQLPELLLGRGITLKQKHRYKAVKVSRTRNWCQIIDGDVQSRICFPNAQGQVKTWKLSAKFGSSRPPAWPWDMPERSKHKKAQLMISGNDVWRISYEDMREWAKHISAREIVECLTSGLEISFDYSRQRYC